MYMYGVLQCNYKMRERPEYKHFIYFHKKFLPYKVSNLTIPMIAININEATRLDVVATN